MLPGILPSSVNDPKGTFGQLRCFRAYQQAGANTNGSIANALRRLALQDQISQHDRIVVQLITRRVNERDRATSCK